MSSCSVLNKSTNAAFFESQANVAPVEAEIEVDDSKKIKGNSKSVYLLGILRIAGDNKYANGVFSSYNPFDIIAPVSAAAAFKAIKSSGADVIVNPQYEVKQTNLILFKTVEATVTGMKGTFKLK
jgi:hypothetical protein